MTAPAGKFSDHLSDVYFADLKLPHAVSAGIAGCGFVRATPIQAVTLPLLLAGQDVAAQAQTGTGKTAAYLVAIFTRFVRAKRHKGSPNPRALIVAPTRELAVQIQEDARQLGHFVKMRIVTVFGGIDYGRQRDQLRAGCDLLIGTPGRLLDYEQQGATSFGEVESLVIDEADRLFDLGFIKDLRRILRRCPPPGRRHSMLFSATLSLRVMELAYEHMNDAKKIEIRPEQITADRVTQVLYHVSQREKIPLLLNLLRREGVERTMLFVNTKRFAERLVSNLERHGFRVGALTGDIPQPRRLKILQDFKSGVLPLLVATDVASRGLHIDGVTHVINVDLPQDPEDYVHRIGRTARAGQSGKAISLADEDYVFSLDAIQRLIGMKIPVEFADNALFAAPAEPREEKEGAFGAEDFFEGEKRGDRTRRNGCAASSADARGAARADPFARAAPTDFAGRNHPTHLRRSPRPRLVPRLYIRRIFFRIPRLTLRRGFLDAGGVRARGAARRLWCGPPGGFAPVSGSACQAAEAPSRTPCRRPRRSGRAGLSPPMPYANLGGHRFYYEVGGEGETVLLLHGSFADADLLEAPATAVSSGFRALRFDRRGHGRSSDAPEPLSLTDEAAEMAALLEWFSTEKAHLLAHDDGAEIAIQFALDFPARTLSLALLAPTLEGFPWKDETLAARRDLLSAFARSPRAAIEERWLKSPAFDVARELEGLFGRLQALYGRARVAGGSLARPAHPGPTQVERLGEIRARTIVLVGDREDPERLRCAAAIVQGIRGAEGATFAGASRFLHMEDPRHVMRRLTDFYIPPEE